ncbi:MAG: hypothetical protein V1661_02715 [bacterium]
MADADKKQIIGFDLDGVIIDHSPLKRSLAAQFNLFLKPEQTPSSIFNKIVPPDILEKVEHFIYNDSEISLRASLMPGAAEGLARVQLSGVPFFLISRRGVGELALKLLEKLNLFPGIFHKNNVFFVATDEGKDVEARKLGITHYIDDKISVLDKLASVEKKALFDQFGIYADAPYERAGGWEDVIKFLKI